jgi:hypothetical protein
VPLRLVGSEMCIRDSNHLGHTAKWDAFARRTLLKTN